MFNKILIANRGENRVAGCTRSPRNGHIYSCCAFDRRQRCDACAHGRRKRLHRPTAKSTKLPVVSSHHFCLRNHRRRSDPSGLWILVGKRRIRAGRRRPRAYVHRPDGRTHPDYGRQDYRKGYHEKAGCTLCAGLGRWGRQPRRSTANW